MKESNKIERLFRERFKDFEATPSEDVWNNIKGRLSQKRKKRGAIVPLWWQMGGIAAGFLLLLALYNLLQNSSDQIHIVDTELEKPKTDAIQESQQTPSDNDVFKIDITQPNSRSVATDADANSPVSQDDYEENNDPYLDPKKSNENSEQAKTEVVTNAGSKEMPVESGMDNNSNAEDPNKRETNDDKGFFRNPSLLREENAIETVVTQDKKGKNLIDELKKIEEESASSKKKDEINSYKWSVSTQIAPVYYNSLAGGSSIDPIFSNNPKTGDINLSYGIQVDRQLNNWLTLRSGVKKINLSYSASGIQYTTSIDASALRNIQYNNQSVNISVSNTPTEPVKTDLHELQRIEVFEFDGQENVFQGQLNQQIGYIEIPAELGVNLLDTRLGINILGGVSTLILTDNEITVSSDTNTTFLGEADNLRTLSFSANAGLGIDYRLTNRFSLNLEPVFKYQLNPYNTSATDFKPYYFGVYTGIRFQF